MKNANTGEQSMYAPLQFISLNPDAGHEFESQIKRLVKNGFNELNTLRKYVFISIGYFIIVVK